MIGAQFRSTYLGGLLLVCLVLGGGTQKGLPTVFALELLALPLALDLALRRSDQPGTGWPAATVVGVICLTFLIQFFPSFSSGPAFVTSDPGRTLDSLVYVGFALVLFFSFGRLNPAERSRMAAWLLTGVILNIALALTQFAASRGLTVELFPYPLDAGFFANANHFSSLLYVAIPFVIYQFDSIDRLRWAALAVLLIVFVEFAAGSTAGIILSLACALISVAVVARVRLLARGVLLGLALAGAVALAFNPGDVLRVATDNPLDRPQITRTTLDAIWQTLPLGSGYGTFNIMYPSVEPDTAISTIFINHAHNEVLELVLEGGIPAAIAMLAYLALLVWRLRAAHASPFAMAALCGIAFVLVHSLVDYPLRTAALAAAFALLNAIYFSPELVIPPQRRRGRRRRKEGRGVLATLASDAVYRRA